MQRALKGVGDRVRHRGREREVDGRARDTPPRYNRKELFARWARSRPVRLLTLSLRAELVRVYMYRGFAGTSHRHGHGGGGPSGHHN